MQWISKIGRDIVGEELAKDIFNEWQDKFEDLQLNIQAFLKASGTGVHTGQGAAMKIWGTVDEDGLGCTSWW